MIDVKKRDAKTFGNLHRGMKWLLYFKSLGHAWSTTGHPSTINNGPYSQVADIDLKYIILLMTFAPI